jgi:hypothetical protein
VASFSKPCGTKIREVFRAGITFFQAEKSLSCLHLLLDPANAARGVGFGEIITGPEIGDWGTRAATVRP